MQGFPSGCGKAARLFCAALCLLSVCLSSSHAQSVVVTPLYMFSAAQTLRGSPNADGALPVQLLQARNGDFYGLTIGGGRYGFGTIFQLTPAGVLTVLHDFSPFSSQPFFPNLIQATDGNFYGTWENIIYKLTPSGVFTTFVEFKNATPITLLQAGDGNFYTLAAGFDRITPDGHTTVLYTFRNPKNGNSPIALIQATDGDFYGVSYEGGAYGNGTFFKLNASGKFTLLYSFQGGNDASRPETLIQGSDGNFYGTSYFSGPDNLGTIFRITPEGAETVLYAFKSFQLFGGGIEGAFPVGLVQGSDGNLYGIAQGGGRYYMGTVFALTTAGDFTLLHTFPRAFNLKSRNYEGAIPTSLIQGADGNLYGTTEAGGVNGTGLVYALTISDVAPQISGLSPNSTSAGGAGFGLRVYGDDFASNSKILWTVGGVTTTLETVYFSANELQAPIPASLIAQSGQVTITVTTPGVNPSNAMTFTIN